ncbi:hypothetical protein [Phenylobacterium montanum]|uniref:Sortilin N-terminal domain-containing protein n=1 Tax=Phenylobacterium montanum TaxID=2823693 RepID=A0A975IXD2_9CAUL|nr:hypothetical protein [Caulobacter sp. S6]QUD89281.1 hypothetical protein KCG34_05220 [Caulobacter sp. S6]
MTRRTTKIMAAAALAAIASGGLCAAHAAGVDPPLFQDLHWRSIGPFRGGRVLAVDGAPDKPQRFYFGAVNGGVWRTDDAGRTWAPIFDSAPVGSIGAIAVAPSAPGVIYVGTGEADMRSDIAQGVGMFKSVDGGASWAAIGLSDTQAIGKILVDPRDPDALLVAALGHPYGPNAERGVFRSTDGGKTWAKTLFKDADTGAIDLAFQPGHPDVVYAALWQTRRPPWNVYPPSSGPGGGLYKSVDGGKTWTAIGGQGLPASPGRIGIAVTPAKPDRLFALVDAEEGGLFRSDDAGATWAKVSDDKRIWNRGWYFGGITVDPKNADRVWVCDTIVLRSDDGGAHFTPVKGDPTGDDFHVLWIDPNNTDRRILGVDQGALVTMNGGATWSSWFNQPTGQFYHVATDNRFPYRVYGAQQDSGAAGVPSRTDSQVDGINMTEFHEVTAGGESDEIAPDPDDPDTVYGGRVDKLDLRSGQTRSVDPTLAFPDNYRGTWTLPLTFGKRDHTLYFGNQRVFATTDGGQSWKPISPDLTRPNPQVPTTLDAATIADTSVRGPRRGVVYDIGPSPVKDGLIWAGTDDGLVWRTRDGGKTWDNVTPKALGAWSKVGTVEPSHFDPEVAYIAVDRHRLDDFAPYIYRTRDGGKTWTPITAGLAEGGVLNAVNVVREDPAQKGLLYAGTERGAFVSFDDGDHWQPLQSGLPRTSVRDITLHDADLVIATHGRGFYVMDDIAPLRALAADASAGARLFTPAPAIRLHEPPFVGTPMPKDEPIAQNPPDGAYIDYVVAAGASPAHVTVAILDAQGTPVARFASTDPAPAPDLAKIDAAPEWVVRPGSPSATPGQHRFVWDLHYAKPDGLGDEDEGVWAPPGRYTVELTVDGKSWRQPLEILPDPRVKATPADLQAEFALARQIEQSRLRIHAALTEAAKQQAALKVQIQAADATHQAGLLAKAAQLDALADIPTDSPRKMVGRASPSVDGLADIAEQLDKLATAVDGADGAPTPDDLAGFAKTSQALEAALARWSALKASLSPAA